MSNPSYRPEGRKYDRRVGFWYYEGENCFTDAELTAMDAAVEKIKEESAAKDAEIARLKKDIERMTLCPPYDPCRNDNCLDEKEAAEQRIRELEEEAAKYAVASVVVCSHSAKCKMSRFAACTHKEPHIKIDTCKVDYESHCKVGKCVSAIRALKEE